jgi:hypothetical protein
MALNSLICNEIGISCRPLELLSDAVEAVRYNRKDANKHWNASIFLTILSVRPFGCGVEKSVLQSSVFQKKSISFII